MALMVKEEVATLAGGCFWCTEAIFRRLKGVKSVTPGYAGVKDASYEHVSTGQTGAAEAIQITFDPTVITYKTLLEVFWKTHDPTTLNRQGADVGTQYRSAIFYHTDEQKKIAQESKRELEESHYYKNPVVTEITPFTYFSNAEAYHKEYYEKNKNAPYCQLIIDPKIKKLIEDFSDIVTPSD